MTIQLFNGDCLEIMKSIPDKSVDCVITDPPYGMSYQSGRRKEKHQKIENDSNLDWIENTIKELDRVSKPDANWYIFCSWHNVDIFKQEIQKRRNIKNILIWNKNNFGSGDLFCDYAPKYEMIIFCNTNKKLNGGRIPNVIDCDKTDNSLHPTQKPELLIQKFVEKSTNENETVLDCFMGSGTTAMACKHLNRNFIGIEIDEKYFRIAQDRIYGELL